MDDNSGDVVMRGSTVTTTDPANYAFSGKVMLASVIILAVVCIVIAFFHMYARRFLLRVAAATHHNRPPPPPPPPPPQPLPPYFRSTTTTVASVLPPAAGLDQSTIKSIPTFTYSPKTHTAPFECSICLSEFEKNETGRILPKCNHCFHLDCIDMWFHSHTNCPLCRGPVQSISATNQNLPGSPIGNFSVENIGDDFDVIIEVSVAGGADPVSESEGGNGFKKMFGPIRSLRRLLSI